MANDPMDDRHRSAETRPAFPLGRRSRGHDQHPDVEQLDAVAGGETVTRSTRDHVEVCLECRESIAALRKVRADLSRLAAMTMPGDVAERIQAALAAQLPPRPLHDPPARPGADVTTTDVTTTDAPAPRPAPDAGRSPAGPMASAPTGAPQTGTPGTGPGRRPAARPERRPAPGAAAAPRRDWVSLAAVCAAFVTFGAAVLAFYSLRVVDAHHPVAASSVAQGRESAGAAAAGAGPGRLTMMADSRTTVAPAEVGQHGRELLTGRIAGSVALSLPLTGPTGDATDAGAVATARSTGAVPFQAVAPAAARHPASVVAAPPAAAGTRLRALLDTPDLRSCYQSLIAQSGGEILAVDRIRYDGQSALLIVLSIPMQPAAARVLVVDTHCGVVSVSAALWYSATTLRR